MWFWFWFCCVFQSQPVSAQSLLQPLPQQQTPVFAAPSPMPVQQQPSLYANSNSPPYYPPGNYQGPPVQQAQPQTGYFVQSTGGGGPYVAPQNSAQQPSQFKGPILAPNFPPPNFPQPQGPQPQFMPPGTPLNQPGPSKRNKRLQNNTPLR